MESFQGWESYPEGLSVARIELDVSRSNHRLGQLSKELFVENDESEFAAMNLSAEKGDGTRNVAVDTIRSVEELSAVMNLEQATSMFFLNQSYTWSRLRISEEQFRRLFMRLRVHPSFLDIVYLFREKISPDEEGFSSLFVDVFLGEAHIPGTVGVKDCTYYIGYNIKYVARHGRDVPRDPFSIREVGVYQHFSQSTQRNNWILLQATDQLKDRLRRALSFCDDISPAKQFLLHSMIILDVSEDWRDYLVYLEDDFSQLVDKGVFTNVRGPQLQGDIVANFSDLRKLHIMIDKLRRLAHILNLNIRVGRQLREGMSRIQKTSPTALHANFERLEANVNRFLLGQETSMERIETLIARGSGISQLVQNIQDIRAAEASKEINNEMRNLTEQGITENKLMKTLTQRSSEDTRSMMTIALISAIFLPATFVATLFGSNFFNFSDRDNALIVASNFWIYIVFAAVFSGACVLSWVVWRRRRLRQRCGLDEIDAP